MLSGLLDRPHGLPSPPVLLLCVLLLWNSCSCRWLAVTQQPADLVVHGTNGRSGTKPHQSVQKAQVTGQKGHDCRCALLHQQMLQ